VIVAEDSAFWQHEGLDYQEIRNSIETAFARGGEIRGASTITQQLAKNLYLSPSRNPLRKLRELIITRRLEAALPKARIFEIYLNVVEWGEGIWGVEAAARTYFGVPASALSREQSALLAGALINPIAYSPARPPPRLLRRQQIILSRMGGIRPPSAVPVIAPAQEPDPTAPLADEIGSGEQDADDTPDTAPASPGDPSLPEPDGPAEPPLPDPVPPLEEPARTSRPADDGGPPAQ
jgi:monofunctional biosynthetic peptidoglycan transglycosylase